MSNPPSTGSRIAGAAFAAAVVAIMVAGPGTVLVAPAVRLTEPIVCGKDERIEYQYVRYGHQGPGESSLEVACVARAGGASRNVLGKSIFTLFGIYFAVLFPVLLFWRRTPAAPWSSRPAGADAAGGD